MTWTRLLPLPTLILLLCLGAAPAQATLLVQSGSSGLIVQDKNGLGDRVNVLAATLGGNPVFVVENNNAFDVFKFDRRTGCNPGSTSNRVVCAYNNGKLNLGMAGGDDQVRVGTSGATSSSVNLSDGNDLYVGIGGVDDVFAGNGNDNVTTGPGNDDIGIASGEDTVDSGSGNDEIDLGNTGFQAGGDDTINSGSGNDEVHLGGHIEDSSDVNLGSGNDTFRGGSGDDDVIGGTGTDDIQTFSGDDQISARESSPSAGVKDTVRCGFDNDDVVADLKDDVDAISDPGGGTCEEVDRSPVGETPQVRIAAGTLRVSRTGAVNVLLRCPRGTRSLGCRGTLQLRLARTRRGGVQASRSRKVRYAIRAARRKRVSLQLSSRDVSALRSRRRARKRTLGVLVSVEKGRKGRKTTVRNPRLRLR